MARMNNSIDADKISGINSLRKIHIPLVPFEETIRKSKEPNCIVYQISKGVPLSHHYSIIQFHAEGNNTTRLHYNIEIGSKIPLINKIVAAIFKKMPYTIV
jgi:hypothetical protein